MEAVMTKPAVRAWVKPDHKLSEWEIEDILEHWDYDPEHAEEYEECNADGTTLIDDEFGNPSYGSFEAMYEERNGLLAGPFMPDELFAEFNKWREEADN